MESDTLCLEMVRSYMLSKGGKLPNSDLVKHFKKYLNDPDCKAEARLLFKDIVNTIAFIQKEGDVKFIVLKGEYAGTDKHDYEELEFPAISSFGLSMIPSMEDSTPSTPTPSLGSLNDSPPRGPPPYQPPPPPPLIKPLPPPYQPPPPVVKKAFPPSYQPSLPIAEYAVVNHKRRDAELSKRRNEFGNLETDDYERLPPDLLSHSYSTPNLSDPYQDDYADGALESKDMHHSNDDLLDPPRPPPRRKGCIRGKENRGTKIEEKLRQFSEDRESNTSPPRSSTIKEDLEKSLSPGMVKERAEKLNQVSEEPKVPKPMSSAKAFSSNNLINQHRKIYSKNVDDDDNSSVSSMDPRRKEWIIKASKADYNGLVKLLQEEPKLASYKDFISGFTALHWGAKHGNPDIVKLIAGTYKVNPNVKSNGGYTPLHIAALFRHEEIMELLVNTYEADKCIRDHSGKRPYQYLPPSEYASTFNPYGTQNEHRHSLPRQSNKTNGSWYGKDSGFQGAFVRIGSLNSKVRKTAASVIHSGTQPNNSKKSLSRMKSWGSADSLRPARQQSNSLMPPPKHPPKKKKGKRGSAGQTSLPAELTPKTHSENNSDSDSGCGVQPS